MKDDVNIQTYVPLARLVDYVNHDVVYIIILRNNTPKHLRIRSPAFKISKVRKSGSCTISESSIENLFPGLCIFLKPARRIGYSIYICEQAAGQCVEWM